MPLRMPLIRAKMFFRIVGEELFLDLEFSIGQTRPFHNIRSVFIRMTYSGSNYEQHLRHTRFHNYINNGNNRNDSLGGIDVLN